MTKLISEESKGVFVIMATPFTDDGALDLQSADRLVEFYLEEGVHGLTVLGVMGEAPKLSLEEQVEFTQHVLKRVDGRVPVIVGVSNPGMDNLETLSRTTMDRGAGGVMIAGIPGLKTDEQVETYFKAVADRLGEEIPICLQDYPPTTTVFISVGVVNRLIADMPHLKMFKHEDCPGHRKLTRLRQAPETDGTRRVSILTGNNGLYVPQELARGADGIMTGFAFPGMLVDVYNLFQCVARRKKRRTCSTSTCRSCDTSSSSDSDLRCARRLCDGGGRLLQPRLATRGREWMPGTTPRWTGCSNASG